MSERWWEIVDGVHECGECWTKVDRSVVLKHDHYHYICLPCLKQMTAGLEATVTMSGTWTWQS